MQRALWKSRRTAIGAVLILVAAPILVGCSILEGPTPETPDRVVPTEPEVTPELVPGGSAEDNVDYFTEVLRAYAEGDGAVQGTPIVNAVVDAGFDKSLMQVSFDTSKTNLPADSIFVSVRVGTDCLIGQIVTADRSFVSKNEPAVGPNSDICLIGQTRVIDW